MGKVLKGAYIVTSKKTFKSDLRIENEIIESIGSSLEKEGDEIIDLAGSYILPGGIDVHTHFDLGSNTSDDFESGTKAAIAGGTTTIIDFVDCHKGQKISEALEIYKEKTEGKCYCDYGFHMTLCEWNKEVEKEMEKVVSIGITSFKMYMAYKNLQVNEEEISNALKKAKELEVLILFHCENGDKIVENINNLVRNGNLEMKYHAISRPPEVELDAVKTLIKVAEEVDYPVYIVHLSSKLALEAVNEARKKGIKIFVETCPHYLLLNKDKYELQGDNGFEGAMYIMSPPLRDEEDNKALWKAIKDGEIDTVATDHCSFNYVYKKALGEGDFSKVPNGIPGVEHRIQLMYSSGVCENLISLNKMVELTSTKPAKIFGLYPLKGEIAVGSHADLIIIDEGNDEVIKAISSVQKVDFTPYEGFPSKAKIKMVFLRGNKMVEDKAVNEENLIGRYLKRKKCL
ncbi:MULTISPECIES: dihydropyrimidinase [unclassified Clostridium]|uniref:dihydropyrimidinase n=1 Tax=unclassified Clostridium TaxID=2614128 RepID=UPI000297D3C2|nr:MULTISPECIES: dihydropyrimidinase [unclassified Clostridium]EKQ55059.1 MAG: D-hydantoinase [Clostridium sp. Maddingley MBC34-26]